MKKKNSTKVEKINKRSWWDQNYVFYIIKDHKETIIKMGISGLWNFRHRLSNMNSDSLSAGGLEVLKTKWIGTTDIVVAKKFEQKIFDEFAEYREKGEKFIISRKLMKQIEKYFVMDNKENRLYCDLNRMLGQPSVENFKVPPIGKFGVFNFQKKSWELKCEKSLGKKDKHFTREELITPEISIELLARNSMNRKLKPSRIKSYIRELKNNNFLSTPNPITFGTSGALYDGQHRLLAIRDSGIAATQSVSYNYPPEVYYYIDRGTPKSDYDVLSHEGDFSKNAIGVITFMMETEGIRAASPTEKKEYHKKYHDDALWLCETLSKHKSFKRNNVICSFLKAQIYSTEIKKEDGQWVREAAKRIASLDFDCPNGDMLKQLYYAVNNEKDQSKIRGARKDYTTGSGRIIAYRRPAQALKNFKNGKKNRLTVPRNEPFPLDLKVDIDTIILDNNDDIDIAQVDCVSIPILVAREE